MQMVDLPSSMMVALPSSMAETSCLLLRRACWGSHHSCSASSAELDTEHTQKVLEMEHTQQLKLKERQKFFEEAFQQDMEQYLSTGYLQTAERRGELPTEGLWGQPLWLDTKVNVAAVIMPEVTLFCLFRTIKDEIVFITNSEKCFVILWCSGSTRVLNMLGNHLSEPEKKML